MPLMKAEQAGTLLKSAIVLDMGDLRKQAQRIVEKAQAQGEQIIAQAQQEAARLAKQATDDAFEAGKAEGLERGIEDGRQAGRSEAFEQAAPEFAKIQGAWLEASGQLDAQCIQIEQEARHAVIQFALRFAEKLVHRVVEVDPGVIVDQLAAALEHVMRPIDATVRICPDDRPALEEAMPRLLGEITQLKHLHLVDDAELSRGGCTVTYGQGAIDASLETQIRRLVELMVPGDSSSDAIQANQESSELADMVDEE